MINLINIGHDIGDLTVNAFNAIIESDIIINYDNIDLSPLESYTNDKEVIDADSMLSKEDSKDSIELEEDMIQLDEDSEEFVEDEDSIYAQLKRPYSLIEIALKKSLDNNVVIISSNNQNIYGITNLLIQISSKFNGIELKVYPGVSPIDYSSAILGAPLTDFAVIDLSNPLASQGEIENKIKSALNNNFIIFVHNIKGNFLSKENGFDRLKKIIKNFNDELMTGIVNGNSYEICQFKDINEEAINEDTALVIGNKLTYELEGHMISSCDYIVEPKFISQNIDFFERYLKDETPKGLDYDCEYLPCHKTLESCDFCYCPFYPCADAITGGEWIKDRDIWSCQHCDWIHLENPCQAIRERLEDVIEDKNDLKTKHLELLKLRRECLLKTLK